MIYSVRTYPDPVLKKKAEVVTSFDAELAVIVDNMFETMYHARGVGLAAPQVGILKQLCVMDPNSGDENLDAEPVVLINPVLVRGEGEIHYEEGCLSVPGHYAEVTRFEEISVQAHTLLGELRQFEFKGFAAIVCQHEMDHLHGKLFIDRIGSSERDLIKRRVRKAQKEKTSV
ncbi:peptide deformylase [Desulfurispira natronophila]|uniref:Peptide deformylase n=1 Tax=Desulfurispira natronophila TaxID=682562 RepID=A0A7W7Y4C3_9BACT|nr:peptide deformylase [Desulfurispira natronophila]MBB5021845.1 peptide deformylase [Desulfurispira natronophila]